MNIKNNIVRLAEKLTGRKCSKCRHNRGGHGHCCHPSGTMFMRCWNSITRPGWAYSFGKAYSRLCASLVELMRLHAARGLTMEDEQAVHNAHMKLMAAAGAFVEELPESKKELYEKTVRRLARCGAKGPASMIVFLAEEIEHYREKISNMEMAWQRYICQLDGKTESGLISED